MSHKLHPSVREFKVFLQEHPKLVKEVRKSGQGMQTYYEKWALLGEDDPFWDQFKEKTDDRRPKQTRQGRVEWMDKLIEMSERIDMNKVQSQVQNLSETISTVQGLLSQFQSSGNESSQQEPPQPGSQGPPQQGPPQQGPPQPPQPGPPQQPDNQEPGSNENLFSIFKD